MCHAGKFPFRQHGVGATWTGTDGAIRRRLNETDLPIAERQTTWLKPPANGLIGQHQVSFCHDAVIFHLLGMSVRKKKGIFILRLAGQFYA